MDTVITGPTEKRVARRVPRPFDPINVRNELERAEHKAIEDAAHKCGLSAASFVRLVLIEAARAVNGKGGDARKSALLAIADEIDGAAAAANKKKPGRPPKEKPKGG